MKRGTYLLDYGQDPGLCIIVSVGSNAQVDLLGVVVAAVGGHQSEERVFGRLGDDIGVEGGGSHWCELCRDLRES